MNNHSLEMKVGLFVILGIAVISLITLFIGQYRLLRGHGYTLYAEFSNVVGLNPGGSVRIAGVEVGEVKEITLDGNKARITLTIFPNVTVYKDAQVELKTIGALGDKYIMISPGTPERGALTNGDTITTTISESDLSDVIKNVQEISANINEILGDEKTKKDLKEIVANMKDSSSNLSDITAKINRGEGTLGKLMTDDSLYTDVKESSKTLKEVAGKIEKGEGTLGRLVQDDSLYVESENTMREFRKAAEGIEEQTPISVMSTIFGLIF
jgi:phospholipid/cholesterol/gamma-HCH transport system substrate-binding protein